MRTTTTTKSLGALMLWAILCLSPAAHAAPDTLGLKEGVDYRVLATPAPAPTDRIEVLFFYGYADPQAPAAMELWRQWTLDPHPLVRLQGVPAVRNDGEALGARIFYALTRLGRESSLSPSMVEAIGRGIIDPQSPASWAQWLEQEGIDSTELQKTLNDGVIVAQTSAIPQILQMYGVTATPAVVVNGRFVFQAPPAATPAQAQKPVANAHRMVEFLLSRVAAPQMALQ